MGRAPRSGSDSGIHHVMNRGVDRGPVFFADDDRLELGRRLAHLHEAFGVSTLAYCLMGNHYHLLVRADDGVLPEAMQHLGSVYTRHTNARIGRDGPLFRGRYHAISVEDEGYLAWVTRYIHRNPLALADVTTPRAYRWSSYRAYLGLRPQPSFLDTRLVLDAMGGRAAMAAFTDEDDGATRWRAAAVGGRPIDLADIHTAIAGAVAAVEVAADREVNLRGLERTLLVLLHHRGDAHVRGLLDAELGARSPKAVRHAHRRATDRLAQMPEVARALALVEGLIAHPVSTARSA